jgi:regulator of protease activity HflC (stomatin/prohibitin superfamily)
LIQINAAALAACELELTRRGQVLQSGEKGESQMTTRDAYVKKLKEQLDRWNAEIGKFEAKSREPLAQMKETYARQLKELRDQRAALQRQMAEMQKASEQAWTHMQAGAEKAWKALDESFKKAWSDFK